MKPKLIVYALLFLLLTALKICLFSSAEKAPAASAFSRGLPRLKSEISSFGRELWGSSDTSHQGEAQSGVTIVSANAVPDVSEFFPLSQMVEQNLTPAGAPSPAPSENPAADSSTYQGEQPTASTLSAEVLTLENQEKQQAFLISQESFSQLAVPASASLEIPAINFAYTCPTTVSPGCGFGYRLHPIYGDARFHMGVDYPIAEGGEICAFADGTVVSAETVSGYGLCLILEHRDGFRTLYAHCNKILVASGDAVSMGQAVALAGHTGQVTGPHLHFELLQNGLRLNPGFYF